MTIPSPSLEDDMELSVLSLLATRQSGDKSIKIFIKHEMSVRYPHGICYRRVMSEPLGIISRQVCLLR